MGGLIFVNLIIFLKFFVTIFEFHKKIVKINKTKVGFQKKKSEFNKTKVGFQNTYNWIPNIGKRKF